ncbi:Subtilisin-chymotrypsin inhibitor CI-1C [Hordeum vulgare]|nr:Subtilisin-chymotrypsin inhibitor CI-1C [Hordeum vulgare]
MGRAELSGVGRGSRSSWPEAVGLPVATAALLINGDRPDVAVALIMETEPTRGTGRPDPKRVILVSDAAGVVVKTPVVG